jgi:hypothetical protein
MEKSKSICILLSALLLSSCGNNSSSYISNLSDSSSGENASVEEISSNEASSEPSSSQESISSLPDLTAWNESDITLLSVYCGSPIPYPSCFAKGEITLKEQSEGKANCLLLIGETKTWASENYYLSLIDYGYEPICGYDGSPIQSNDGTDYVELTKNSPDGKTGYEIMCYHLDNVSLSEGKAASSYDIISCRNYFSSQKRSENDWSEEDKTVIDYVTTTTLPYVALGEGYGIAASSEDALGMSDYCTKDISREYVDTLVNNGYAYSKITSKLKGAYYLYKNLDNGDKIEILIKYFKGNNIKVAFTPKVTSYSSWPISLISPLEEQSGVSVPSFDVASNGAYLAYTKHGTVYLATYNLNEDFDYYDYIDEIQSELFSWEEKLSVSAYLLRDDNYDDVGFVLTLSLSAPSSTFSSSWPSLAIESGIKEALEIEGIAIPVLDLAPFGLANQMKYTVITESDYEEVYEYYLKLFTLNYGDAYDEATIAALAADYAKLKSPKGVSLSFYDPALDEQIDYVVRYKINEAYKELLYSEGWYKVPDTGGTTYEDPSGKLAIKVSNKPYGDNGYTSIKIQEGSGEAHNPELSFPKKSYEVARGGKISVAANASMLPYPITYSCTADSEVASVSNEGVVSVSKEAEVGTSFTVTASVTDSEGKVYSAKCSLTVTEGLTYASVLASVETLIQNKGYSDISNEDIYAIGSKTKVIGKKLTVNLGQEKSKEECKTLVQESFVPSGFTVTMWEDATNNYGAYLPLISAKKSKSSSSKDLEKLYCFSSLDYALFTLYYYVYTASNGDIILTVESRSISRS